MQTHDFDVPQPEAWRQVAQTLLPWIRPGHWAALDGPLGAGKTTFVQHLIELLPAAGAGRAADVTSPTFALYHEYPTLPPVRHYDLYRAAGDLATGGTQALADIDWQPQLWRQFFVIVEWPDRLPPGVPEPLWTLSIRPGPGDAGRQARWRLLRD